MEKAFAFAQNLAREHLWPDEIYAHLAMRAVSARLFFIRVAQKRAVPSDYTKTKDILNELKWISKSYACDVNKKSDELLFNCIEGKYLIARILEEEHPRKNPQDSLESMLKDAARKPEHEAAQAFADFFCKVHDLSEELQTYGSDANIVFYLYEKFPEKK